MHRAGHHAVGIARLDQQGSKVKNVGGLLAGLLHCHPLLLPEFEKQRSVFVNDSFVGGIHDCGLGDVFQSKLGGLGHNGLGLTQKDYFRHIVGENLVSGSQIPGLVSLREHDFAKVVFRPRCQSCKKTHK